MIQPNNLARLKAKRDALNVEIAMIEKGVERAAYDACMIKQLTSVNEIRATRGKPPLTMSSWLAGAGYE